MKLKVSSVKEYLEAVPEERQAHFNQLRQTILDNLPKGFEEAFQYNMVGYVVPHSLYPNGYHVKPAEPLPFLHIASQKNFIGLYHMGLYADPKIHDWFVEEYPKHCTRKLDMGKSCVRLKKMEEIPFELIAELIKKMSVKEYIALYEKSIQPK